MSLNLSLNVASVRDVPEVVYLGVNLSLVRTICLLTTTILVDVGQTQKFVRVVIEVSQTASGTGCTQCTMETLRDTTFRYDTSGKLLIASLQHTLGSSRHLLLHLNFEDQAICDATLASIDWTIHNFRDLRDGGNFEGQIQGHTCPIIQLIRKITVCSCCCLLHMKLCGVQGPISEAQSQGLSTSTWMSRSVKCYMPKGIQECHEATPHGTKRLVAKLEAGLKV